MVEEKEVGIFFFFKFYLAEGTVRQLSHNFINSDSPRYNDNLGYFFVLFLHQNISSR